MLDISKVLGRSWHILWKYRILWIFGMFLAMAAGGYTGSNFNWSQRYNGNMGPGTWDPGKLDPMFGQYGDQLVKLLIISGIVLLVVVLFWAVVTAFLKYISEVAAIKAVNDYEDTGVKLGFKQLFKIRMEYFRLACFPDQPAAEPAIYRHHITRRINGLVGVFCHPER